MPGKRVFFFFWCALFCFGALERLFWSVSLHLQAIGCLLLCRAGG